MKVLLIELNEFNPELFRHAAKSLNLKNLSNLLKLRHCETFTEEKKEFEGLDPWIQWPSIHYGKPAIEHKVKTLGDNTVNNFPQIWDQIYKKGNNWIVFGAMNARLHYKDLKNTFIPDPWSYKQMAYPSYFENLISLPRYGSKNYSDINYKKLFPKLLKTFFFFSKFKYFDISRKIISKIIKALFTCGLNIHSFATLLDYTYTLLFDYTKQNNESNFSLLFLNHIAHLQHQFWINSDEFHPQMKFGLQICDECIGILLKNIHKDEIIFIANGLRQEKYIKSNLYIYRQKNPYLFLSKIGIKNFEIMQNMTNEGHILFKSNLDMSNSLNLLKQAKLSSGKKLFNVEVRQKNIIFYNLKIRGFVKRDEVILIKDNSYSFYSLFDLICKRTGVHDSKGDIFYKGTKLPKKIVNYELYNYILNLF